MLTGDRVTHKVLGGTGVVGMYQNSLYSVDWDDQSHSWEKEEDLERI